MRLRNQKVPSTYRFIEFMGGTYDIVVENIE